MSAASGMSRGPAASAADVLYVSYDGLLEPVGATQVVPYVEALGRQGFALDVLSFEKPADLRSERVEPMERRLAAAGVRWIRERYHGTPTLPATAWDVWRGRRIVGRHARRRRGLVVHARSVMAGLMALPSHRDGGARLLYDARGFWTAERVESGRWRDASPVTRMAWKAEAALHREADVIVHLTHAAADGVRRLVPEGSLPPIEVVPTCTDLDAFRLPHGDDEVAELRARFGLGAGPVAVHSGTLTGWYRGRDTIGVLRAFVAATRGTALVLTRQVEAARALADDAGAEVIVRSAAPEDVPAWLRACDAGVALVRPTFAKTASAPIKVGEYLAVGLAAAVGGGVGDLSAQLDGSPIAAAVPEDEPVERVGRRLAEMARHPERRILARALAERYYALSDGVRRYAALYRRLGVRPR